jgi:ABC-type Fe3+-siderophore transport system permease subunit
MAGVPPVQVDVVVRFVAENPFFVFLVAAILGVIFFLYFLLRRSLLSARQGYEESVRER